MFDETRAITSARGCARSFSYTISSLPPCVTGKKPPVPIHSLPCSLEEAWEEKSLVSQSECNLGRSKSTVGNFKALTESLDMLRESSICK